MKLLATRSAILMAVLMSLTSQASSQERPVQHRPPHPPVLLSPVTHPQVLSKASPAAFRSFYQSKAEWGHIVDSIWGPGLPLAQKLALFDQYATNLSKYFDGFLSLGLNWDSLKTHYRSKIDSSTSRGRFSAIMARFAMNMRDGHTAAVDTVVTYTPLSPGVPVLVLSAYAMAEHFGAVLTALPDSSALVLRTVPNHPLGLEPGDIVLGYEGVPWTYLVRDLLDAEIPILASGVGARSAEAHALVRSVGNNWHLFETIDILKYSTKDTLHLSVYPLMTLPSDLMMPNEQLDIPGIPSDFYDVSASFVVTGQPLQYGRLPATDVGYVRLLGEWPTNAADELLAAAVDSLWNTKGLIIDMRYNIGGWALFHRAFGRMFGQRLSTIEDAYRAGPTDWNLVPAGNANDFAIPGDPHSLFDRPIAVLLGPTCVSMGDITAQRLRYHPMVRFFGKPPFASLGDNTTIAGYTGWYLHYSISDMFHTQNPGVYLNRSEFPIDEDIWLTPDGVARGEDDVVNRAFEWIETLAYAHNAAIDRPFARPGLDSVSVTASLRNSLTHAVALSAVVVNSEGSVRDSVSLFNDGLHGDGLPGDSLWGCRVPPPPDEEFFEISLRTDDLTQGTFRRLPTVARYTTAGPLAVDSLACSFFSNKYVTIKPFIRNNGSVATIRGAKVSFTSRDSWVQTAATAPRPLSDIPPGAVATSQFLSTVAYDSTTCPGYVNLVAELSVEGETYWTDSVRVYVPTVGVEEVGRVPTAYALGQNYPNPFNPSTTITYELPTSSEVRLSVYDMLGREVTVLVNEKRNAGVHEVKFDGSNLSSGVYIYRLTVRRMDSVIAGDSRIGAGAFLQTRTMLLLK